MGEFFTIMFPNGQMIIRCENFFPCQQQYIRMLDKVIALSDNSQNLREWLIVYLKYRVNTEHKDKVKARLKKNLEFMGARYAQTS